MEIRQNIHSKVNPGKKDFLYNVTKRTADIMISAAALLLLSPVYLLVGYRIIKKDGQPILERELVAGKDGARFTIYRFRTLTTPTKVIRSLPPHPFPENWSEGVPASFTFKRDPAQTVTSTGKWVKKYHLVKLPALYNVLKGEMSLVGPEPEVAEITEQYNACQRGRLKVKPGITGLAQVNGNTNQTHEQKIRDDLFYIENKSLKFDVVLFFRGIKRIFLNSNL